MQEIDTAGNQKQAQSACAKISLRWSITIPEAPKVMVRALVVWMQVAKKVVQCMKAEIPYTAYPTYKIQKKNNK